MSSLVYMGGRMQQPDRTQDRAHILQEKRMCMKMKGKFVRDDASSGHVDASDNNIRKKYKVVDLSDSGSSSDEDISKEKDFSCTSCSRTFSCQQALAGHRNSHRSEWEALLDDPDDDFKIEHPKTSIHPELSPFHTPTIALKQPLGYSSSNLSDASSTSHKLLLVAPQYPLAKTTNILKRQTARAPRYPLVNYPTNTLQQPSTSLRRRPLVNPANTLIRPSPRYSMAKPTNAWKVPSSRYPLANPTNTLKGPSPRYPLVASRNYLKCPSDGHSLACPINNLKRPSLRYLLANLTHNLKEASSGHPLENPTNPLETPLVPATRYSFDNTTNTFMGSSLGASNHCFNELKNTPHMSSLQDPIHPLYNLAKAHSKSALHVRCESMIRKLCQCRQLGQIDMLLRTKSTLLDMKQMIEGNLRHFGTSKRIVDLISFLLDGSFDSSSRYEIEGSSRSPDLFPCTFHPRGGKAIEVHDLFPLTPTQERHSHDNDHSSKVQGKKPDNNGEDVDLDLKL